MSKDVIKSSDNTSKVKDSAESINSRSIEESQKKAVSEETAADKLLNKEDEEENKRKKYETSSYVSFSDYSNTYKYGNDSTSDNSGIVQDSDNSQAVKSGNERAAVKEDNSTQSFHTDKSSVEDSIKGYTASSQVGTKQQGYADDIAPAMRLGNGTNSAVKVERADRNIISGQSSGSVIKNNTSNNVVKDSSQKSVVTDASQDYFKSESEFSSEAKKENKANKTKKAAQEAYKGRMTDEESTEQSNVFTSSQVGTRLQSSDEIAPAVHLGDGTNNTVKAERADRNILQGQTDSGIINDNPVRDIVTDNSQKSSVIDNTQSYIKGESKRAEAKSTSDKLKKARQSRYKADRGKTDNSEYNAASTSSQVGTKLQSSDEIAPAVRLDNGINNAVKEERTDRNIISSQTSDNLIKDDTLNNVVKDNSQKSSVIDNTQSYIKGENEHSETKPSSDKPKKARQSRYKADRGKTDNSEYNAALSSSQVGTKSQSNAEDIAPVTDFGDGTNNIVKAERTDNGIIERSTDIPITESRFDNAVVDVRQSAALSLSKTAAEYVKSENVSERSAFSERTHKKAVKDLGKNAGNTVNPEQQAPVVTAEERHTLSVKEEREISSVVNEDDKTDDIPIYSRDKIDVLDKKNIPETKRIGTKKKGKVKNAKTDESNDKGIISFGSQAVKEKILSSAENSNDSGNKAIGKGVALALAAVDIAGTSVPQSVPQKRKIIKGDIRKKHSDKTAAALKAQNLGIKSEFKKEISNAVLRNNARMDKIILNAKSSVKNIIKGEISELAENDMAFATLDTGIRTVETVTAIKNGTVSAVNSVTKLVRSPKKAVQTVKKYKERVKKLKKLARMNNSAKRKAAKAAAKRITGEAVRSAKALGIKLIVGVCGFLLVFILLFGAVIAIISSFTWQTSNDMDTTGLLKYISSLDRKQQEKWFDSNYTHLKIDEAEYKDSISDRDTKTYDVKYFLAIDPPVLSPDSIDLSTVTDDDCEIIQSEWWGSDGAKRTNVTNVGYFEEVATSSDEFLEKYRMTTDDYRAALAYLQVKNDNLGWLASTFGIIGDYQLRTLANELLEAAYGREILTAVKERDEGDTVSLTPSWQSPVLHYKYNPNSNNLKEYDYFYGSKYSIIYLIKNDIIRFDDDDDAKNKEMKEQFINVYNYGNMLVANLSFPLELADDEKPSDRIAKHFGEQVILKYEPPELDDDGEDVYGKIKSESAYHYATDLWADDGEPIYAPITGYCKCTQREGRAFEYVISTSYNDTGFDFSQTGYVVKISGSGNTCVLTASPRVVQAGEIIGYTASNVSVNYNIPDKDNDTENEDLYANRLFPCFTGTDFRDIDANDQDVPPVEKPHIHMEMYHLPCDFSDYDSIEENVLAPELFFDYSKETMDIELEPSTEPTT